MSICKSIGVDFKPDIHGYILIIRSTTYKDFFQLQSAIQEVEGAANKERDIIISLSEISNRYSNLVVEIFKDASKFSVVRSFERNLSVLESDLLAVNNMQGTMGLEKFQALFKELEDKLEMAKRVLKNWEAVQVTIISVCRFFLSGEVRIQLSGELRRYERIETAFKSIVLSAETHKKLSMMIEVAPDLESSLMDMLHSLRMVTANLQGWLDNKRLIFPRLFFVSDEELIDIVSVAKEPRKLQPYFLR